MKPSLQVSVFEEAPNGVGVYKKPLLKGPSKTSSSYEPLYQSYHSIFVSRGGSGHMDGANTIFDGTRRQGQAS